MIPGGHHVLRVARRARGHAPLLLLLVGLLGETQTANADSGFFFGGAATRGFFGWAASGGYAEEPLIAERGGILSAPIRLEGMFSSRENLANATISLIPTIRYTPPGFADNHFTPYITTGPGFHFQGTWSNLQEFGGVETEGQWTGKWHVFLGASLARGRTTELFAEARYTAPSELDFDYVMLALRFHAADD